MAETLYDAAQGQGQRWIYFIQAGEGGPIKIGVTNDVSERFRNFQIGNPAELRLLCKIPCDTGAKESAFHAMFQDHRIRGEWFHPAEPVMRVANFWSRPPADCPCCKRAVPSA